MVMPPLTNSQTPSKSRLPHVPSRPASRKNFASQATLDQRWQADLHIRGVVEADPHERPSDDLI
jgi:hypothetical protein